MRSVSTQAPAVRRSTGRDLIGVIGEDGNWYWIEVERSRTIRVPERPASGDPPRTRCKTMRASGTPRHPSRRTAGCELGGTSHE